MHEGNIAAKVRDGTLINLVYERLGRSRSQQIDLYLSEPVRSSVPVQSGFDPRLEQ